jgi:hypothetical protein
MLVHPGYVGRLGGLALVSSGAGFISFQTIFAGKNGAYFTAGVLSALFQDVALTVPITTAGQAIGGWSDLSGNNNHGSQATATARPLYQAAPNRAVFDKVDDVIQITIPVGGFIGTMILATDQGTEAYDVNIPAGIFNLGGLYYPGTAIHGVLLRNDAMSSEEIIYSKNTYIAGGSSSTSYGGLTDLPNYWRGMDYLTTFPIINTSSCTNFFATWYWCIGLTSFPVIDTSTGTNFYATWSGCSNLTSFPLINISAGTNFYAAWYWCPKLANFPANFFNGCLATNFLASFQYCALTQVSVDGILTSINSNGTSNGTLNIDFGTSATPSATGLSAKSALISRGWTVTTN